MWDNMQQMNVNWMNKEDTARQDNWANCPVNQSDRALIFFMLRIDA